MEKIESFKLATEMALKWFEIHVAQRLVTMRFFLVAAAFCIGGYLAAFHAGNLVASMAIGVLLTLFALLFKQLDRRTAQLIKLSEDVLRFSGVTLAKELGAKEIDLVKDGVPSFRQIFNLIYWFIGLIGLLGAVVALARSAQT